MKALFNSQTKTVTFAAILLAGSALISRILGLVRDRLLADRFGAGEELDIYFAAFWIPDFVYEKEKKGTGTFQIRSFFIF